MKGEGDDITDESRTAFAQRKWWYITIVAILSAIPFMTLGGGAGTQGVYYSGGFHWQVLLEAIWEAFVVVGVCLGSLALFRQHWNRQGRLAKGLAASAYTVYLIHPLVIVTVASALSTVVLYPLLKFGIAALLVLPLCFLIGSLIRKIPFAERML